MLKQLIQKLQNPALYPHPVRYFKVIETHISYVILTGDFAYKFKKAVNMEFLDFSTLEKRRFYCQEELRLNQPFAPQIYLEVIAITGSEEEPVINSSGKPIEYALKMREFPQANIFTALLSAQKLNSQIFEQLADILATRHQQAKISDKDTVFGTPEHVFAPVQQNFDQIRPLLKDEILLQQLEKLENWSKEQYQLLKTVFDKRKKQGFIRECHGDLHLGNIVLYDQQPLIFDSIEFNDDFRWTDVMGDVGFLAMDLDDQQRPDFANLFINTYFAQTGDYDGLQILNFYKAYRSVVRAKINIMHLQQNDLSKELQAFLQKAYAKNMQLAEQYTEKTQPRLFIMHGISGSGKSTYAKQFAMEINAVHLRSDVERKRLFKADLYSKTASIKTFERLTKLTEEILNAGFSVIVDATFLLKSYRDQFYALAKKHNLSFTILRCEVDDETRDKWLSARQQHGSDPSDANIEIALLQQKTLESLTAEELAYSKLCQIK